MSSSQWGLSCHQMQCFNHGAKYSLALWRMCCLYLCTARTPSTLAVHLVEMGCVHDAKSHVKRLGQRSALIIGKAQWFERSIQTENPLFFKIAITILIFLPNTSQSVENYHVYILIIPPNLVMSSLYLCWFCGDSRNKKTLNFTPVFLLVWIVLVIIISLIYLNIYRCVANSF